MRRLASGQALGDRDQQEDAVQIVGESTDDGDLLLLLSDGMGGHAGGEIASRLTLQTFAASFGASQNRRPQGRLRESLEAANQALAAKIAASPNLGGMGCTLVAVLVVENRIAWCSVGDSILFLFRQGKLSRLNADHSYFGELLELVEAGKMTRAEAEAHPQKNALRSAISGDTPRLIDTNAIETQPGDVLLLASDGLETLSDPEIEAILARHLSADASETVDALLTAVKSKGRPRQDNTSIVYFRRPGETFVAPTAGSAVTSRLKTLGLSPFSIAAMVLIGVLSMLGVGLLTYVMSRDPIPAPDPGPTDVVSPSAIQPAPRETVDADNSVSDDTAPSIIDDTGGPNETSQTPGADGEDGAPDGNENKPEPEISDDKGETGNGPRQGDADAEQSPPQAEADQAEANPDGADGAEPENDQDPGTSGNAVDREETGQDTNPNSEPSPPSSAADTPADPNAGTIPAHIGSPRPAPRPGDLTTPGEP